MEGGLCSVRTSGTLFKQFVAQFSVDIYSKAIRNPHGVTFDQNADLLFTKDLVRRFTHSDIELQEELLNLVALETKVPSNDVAAMEIATTDVKPRSGIFSRILMYVMLMGIILGGAIYSSHALSSGSTNTESAASNEDNSDTESVESENPWDTFPRKWSGSYTGHSSWSASGDVNRHIDINLESVSESGALRGTCEVNSEDSGEGHMHCKYTVDGEVDWQTGEIELNGVSWINQGEFSWMTNFNGELDDARLSVTGYSVSAREGSNAGDWSMNAVTD